jgi:tetratricopeptide (TPR) repeat protein
MYLYGCERTAACLVLTLLMLCGADVNVAAQKKAIGGTQARANLRRRQPPPAEGDERASSYIDAGERHADAGDWAAALQSYKQATAIDPRHPEAHIYVGDAYMNLGKYEEALAAYKDAVRVAPSNAEAHYSLGEAYNYLNIYSAAIRPLVQATRLDSNYAEAHYSAGHAYLRQENFKEALPYLRRAVRLKPDNTEAHLSLGLTYLGLEQIKPAEEQLNLLEGMNPALARELDKELRRVAGARTETNSKNITDTATEGSTVRTQPRKPEPDGEILPTPISRSPRAQTQRTENASALSPQPRPAQVKPAEPSSGSSASTLAAELAHWDRIKNSNDPVEFDAYLNKYPAGEFAGLARIRQRILESKRGGAENPGVERKPQAVAAAAPTKTQDAAPVSVVTPTPLITDAPRRGPTIEETLRLLKENFSTRFTYTTIAPGEDDNVVKVTSEVVIEYEPLRFDSCRVEWRHRIDTFSVAFSDLDALSVKIEPRSRPNTTFSIPVWTLSIKTVGGTPAIRALKGDSGGTARNYNILDLQFGSREKAEKVARLVQQAIILCASVP